MKASADHVLAVISYAKFAEHAKAAKEALARAHETSNRAEEARQEAWRAVKASHAPVGAYAIPGDKVVMVGGGDYPDVTAMQCGKGSQW